MATLFKLANGRKLPPLHFVIAQGTIDQLGWTGKEIDLTNSLLPHSVTIIPTATGGKKLTARDAASASRAELIKHPESKGVVIIGSYDTVPAQLVDVAAKYRKNDAANEGATEAQIQESISRESDMFLVWNDDHFGSWTGDGLPALPVSRIPSWGAELEASRTAVEFVVDLLEADDNAVSPARTALDVYASEFSFVPDVFTVINAAHTGVERPSPDATANSPLQNWSTLAADCLYVVLHGTSEIGRELRDSAAAVVATCSSVSPTAVPPGKLARAIFSGCCWGGQIVDYAAAGLPAGVDLTARSLDDANPLALINYGATGLAGFTGSHWMPAKRKDPTESYWGRPLHDIFWRNYVESKSPPSKALFDARLEYIANRPYPDPVKIPHPLASMLELKTFWSATCLGLGW